ncbi:AQG_2a_G0044260.mRNA.1.CDS.1 [Saccharomyces cerevisiae]|nr:hypothetical protein AWRI796_3836 [Saccharomyces cerevisiae AWRI796]CAI4696709.1 AAR_G0043190.mRNA.1.CDS.1 [Saccharomyces cerevisiae]EGA73582.1 hypothetical protein AWRI796_3843 [Saccharomyces cerevisiae AWRI796]CAI4732928.1 AQG_2a_G0044260.mRNA.1.CDS.1 [Saccharomyces cerevisiae]CAI6848368.1 AAR_G0043190.mRNA.1.CDS.1 [Saccharomyces cerevisiae]
MDLLAVDWIESETYGVTVKVQGAESIDWKYLSSLKLTGIDGPQSCVEVTKSNKDCSINSATEFTVSFPVYAQKIENEPCQVLMPSFQIEYEFLKGEAQQYSEGWKWGETCFNLESGCQHQSSSSKANCDFPLWHWNCGHIPGCPSSSSSTSTASGSSTTWTPSTSETPCTETPSGSSTSSSWASLSSETPCTETPSGSGSWASSSTETPCTETPGSSSSWTSSNTETPCTETPGSSSSWASSSSETPCTECEQGSTSSTYWASSSSTYWESSSSTYWVSSGTTTLCTECAQTSDVTPPCTE